MPGMTIRQTTGFGQPDGFHPGEYAPDRGPAVPVYGRPGQGVR
jgi:hypothetical protein